MMLLRATITFGLAHRRGAALLVAVFSLSSCGGRILVDVGGDSSGTDASSTGRDAGSEGDPADGSSVDGGAFTPHDGDVAEVLVDAAAVAPCMTGGNVMHLEGDPGDPVYSGSLSLDDKTDGPWAVTSNESIVEVTTPDKYGVFFSSFLGPSNLGVGVFENADGRDTRAAGKPLMILEAAGRVCGVITGRFQIFEMNAVGDPPRITASFEQHCENNSAMLRGCVHFSQ